MKKLFQNIPIFLLGLLIVLSCREEENLPYPKFQNGANFRATPTLNSSSLLLDSIATEKFVFNTSSLNAEEIEKVDLITTYFSSADSTTSEPVTLLSLMGEQLNSTVEITSTQFGSAFGKTLEQINGGDMWDIAIEAKMKDGRVFNRSNSSPAIKSSGSTNFTTALSVAVVCTSKIKPGVYSTLTTGESTDSAPNPNPTIDFPAEITIVGEGSTFILSDMFGGLYFEWYNVYGITGAIPATIDDVCGAIAVQTFQDPFGGDVSGTGTVDEATGIITINWKNAFGDVATTIYTPK